MNRIQHILHRTPRPVSRHGALVQTLLALGVVTGVACVAHEGAAGPDAGVEGLQQDSEAVAPSSLAAASDPDADGGLSIAWLPDAVADFAPEIIAASRRHGLDPNLVAIVVLVESGGRPEVRSPVGARGLMQVMPATAERIAQRRGLRDHDPTRLDDPEYNLDFGAWYLARQLETFGSGEDMDDAIALAAAAYNGGPDRLHRTLRGEDELSDESSRYCDLVSTLWAQRDLETSPTLSAQY